MDRADPLTNCAGPLTVRKSDRALELKKEAAPVSSLEQPLNCFCQGSDVSTINLSHQSPYCYSIYFKYFPNK